MGGRKGSDGEPADLQGAAEGDGLQTALRRREPPRQLPAGPLRSPDGTAGVLKQGLESGDMVGMGVGDEDGVQGFRRQVQGPKGLGHAAAGDAGVHQQMGLFPGDDQGIAAGAAGQGM